MRLDDAPESGNVEDRRGMSTGLKIGGAGGAILAIIGLVFGFNPARLGIGGSKEPPDPKYKAFASKVLGTLEVVWKKEFEQQRYVNVVTHKPVGAYREPKLVLFTSQVSTGGCGVAPSDVGPFYCPGDNTLYLDPSFFAELEKLGGSKGEFAQAYVIAHENGHHVQNLLGYSRLVDERRGTRQENEYSVRLELQADYLAGVWANKANKQFKILEGGDLESAIRSANAIGDDKLQEKARGRSWPEKYTHGTAAQRAAAFSAGARTGDATQARLDRFFQVGYNQHGELTPEPW